MGNSRALELAELGVTRSSLGSGNPMGVELMVLQLGQVAFKRAPTFVGTLTGGVF